MKSKIMKTQIVVDRLEEERAVFITPEKKEIIIPKSLINFKLKEGQIFWLHLTADEEQTKEKELLAKKVLNEIISSNSSTENA